MFSVDLTEGISQQEAEQLTLISRYGMTKQNLLEKQWEETNALSDENIISAIINEEVINKIRQVINRDSGCSISNEQIQNSVEGLLNIS